MRHCLLCGAVIGACLHAATEPAMVREDDEQPAPNPVTFVISAPAVISSTTSMVTARWTASTG